MTTSISDSGLQFAGGNLVDIKAAMPTTGSYSIGDLVIEKSTNGELSGWKRLTNSSNHVLGTDWSYFGGFGVNQTWQAFTSGNRILGTTYYNTTGKPIFVSVAVASTATSTLFATMNGSISLEGNSQSAAGLAMALQFIVPPNGSYTVAANSGGTWASWNELR